MHFHIRTRFQMKTRYRKYSKLDLIFYGAYYTYVFNMYAICVVSRHTYDIWASATFGRHILKAATKRSEVASKRNGKWAGNNRKWPAP